MFTMMTKENYLIKTALDVHCDDNDNYLIKKLLDVHYDAKENKLIYIAVVMTKENYLI